MGGWEVQGERDALTRKRPHPTSGTPKTKESFGALIAAAPQKLARSHGRVEITLGSPISLARCAQQQGQLGQQGQPAPADAVVRRLAAAVSDQFIKHLAVPPGALVAAILLLHRKRAGSAAAGAEGGGIPISLVRTEVGALRRRVVERGTNILDGRVIAQVCHQNPGKEPCLSAR